MQQTEDKPPRRNKTFSGEVRNWEVYLKNAETPVMFKIQLRSNIL